MFITILSPADSTPNSRSQTHTRRPLGILFAGIMALLAVGCGGGGGGGGSNAPASNNTTNDTTTPGGTNPLPGEPGGVSLPDSVTAYQTTVYPLVAQYCAFCHKTGPGSPIFAQDEVQASHDSVLSNQKVNLANPPNSRLVQRLAADSHYCWSNCASDAAQMLDAVTRWAAAVNVVAGEPTVGASAILSSATTFAAAAPANTRTAQNLIALWTFSEGNGTVARDTSGVAPAIDLALTGAKFAAGGGVEFVAAGDKAVADAASSKKLSDRIVASKQYTLEAWVVPANTTQAGPARIMTYALDAANANTMMGQATTQYAFRNRNPGAADGNGNPRLDSPANSLKTELTHVVMTFDPTNQRRIFLNGELLALTDPQATPAVDLSNWNATYLLALGNVPNATAAANDRIFKGQIRLAAIYDRALPLSEVKQNFAAGVRPQLLLNFDVSSIVGAADSFVQFYVGDYDAQSYLFGRPSIITSNPSGFPIKNIRIAVNGNVPAAGQAFSTIDTTVTSSPQSLSIVDTVIAKDKGIAQDNFQLVFEVLAARQNVVTESLPPVASVSLSNATFASVGIRTFSQINDTMSAVTGVPVSNTAVRTTFEAVKQQLPSATDVNGFLASQQANIFKLSLEYCNALVDSTALRDAFFGTNPAVAFGAGPNTALDTAAERDVVTNRLLDRMVGVNLSTQPNRTALNAEVSTLLAGFVQGCTAATCDATRTRAFVKAACTSVLSSAVMLIQ